MSSVAPIIVRLNIVWDRHKDAIAGVFPKAQGMPGDLNGYLSAVDDSFINDAYNSLSIEGYLVTHELVERVSSNKWSPERYTSDRELQGALAARGYWEAFQLVKQSVAKVIAGSEPGNLVKRTHVDWYRELFKPFEEAKLADASSHVGYRNISVFLRGSRYVPPRWQTVVDAMDTLFDLLTKETEPSVRAVLGHWLFGYVHPYPDGNGRLARFVMNVMLASGGYPWTVIRVEDRGEYMRALESASMNDNITPFANFIANNVRRTMDETK